jgi:bifunctional non-homologous end joining protein LigD
MIAARKGAAPRPFMTRGRGASRVVGMPGFVPPQLCRLVDRPPSGDGWVHEIKFDGYRLQLQVSKGAARLRTRKGLEWTDS